MEQPPSDTEIIDDPKSITLQTLIQKHRDWHGGWLYQYKGFWCPLGLLQPIISARKNFKSVDTDIILATMPKAGTTWLKALTFSIVNRFSYTVDETPLLTTNPHDLIPYFEINLYMKEENPDLEKIPSPRIFAAHIHYELLPESIKESNSKVVYICRNPMDQLVSLWHYMPEMKHIAEGEMISLEEAAELYCSGVHAFGPFWDHMIGYWNAHLKNPEKVLFLKYEDLKRDIVGNVKKIADFLGYPFSLEEENEGLIEQICEVCSFNSLKNLEVNQVGSAHSGVKNSSYFRKGEVGDGANYLSPSMIERIEKLTEMKLKGSGMITFNFHDGNKDM